MEPDTTGGTIVKSRDIVLEGVSRLFASACLHSIYAEATHKTSS